MKYSDEVYIDFFSRQRRRVEERGISVEAYSVSHIAIRAGTLDEYLGLRERLETQSRANVENQWSGRPISKLLLSEPVVLSSTHNLELIELIPPPHRSVYPMGLEHVGFVVGEQFREFGERFGRLMTGQQDQGPFNQPYYITFHDGTAVKFHALSLREVVTREGGTFDNFYHASRTSR